MMHILLLIISIYARNIFGGLKEVFGNNLFLQKTWLNGRINTKNTCEHSMLCFYGSLLFFRFERFANNTNSCTHDYDP